MILKYAHNIALETYDGEWKSYLNYGSMELSYQDTQTRTEDDQPYLSFIIYLDNKETFAESSTVSLKSRPPKVFFLALFSMVAAVGGLWTSINGVLKVFVVKYNHANFTNQIVQSLYMKKKPVECEEVDPA